MPFVKAKSPLPTKSLRSLRAAAHSTSPALWLHHAHPFVVAAEKSPSHAVKQRVWSRSCGVQDLWQWWYETAANQRTLVEIELLATVAWKWGCQPFSCPCSKNLTHCPKEICSTFLSKESIPAIPFGMPSIHSLSEAWGSWELQHTLPALHYACITPIPLLQLQKKTSLMQLSRGFGHAVVVSKICDNGGMRQLQTNEHLWRLSL